MIWKKLSPSETIRANKFFPLKNWLLISVSSIIDCQMKKKLQDVLVFKHLCIFVWCTIIAHALFAATSGKSSWKYMSCKTYSSWLVMCFWSKKMNCDQKCPIFHINCDQKCLIFLLFLWFLVPAITVHSSLCASAVSQTLARRLHIKLGGRTQNLIREWLS